MQPQLAASSSGQDSTEQVRHKLYRVHPQFLAITEILQCISRCQSEAVHLKMRCIEPLKVTLSKVASVSFIKAFIGILHLCLSQSPLVLFAWQPDSDINIILFLFTVFGVHVDNIKSYETQTDLECLTHHLSQPKKCFEWLEAKFKNGRSYVEFPGVPCNLGLLISQQKRSRSSTTDTHAHTHAHSHAHTHTHTHLLKCISRRLHRLLFAVFVLSRKTMAVPIVDGIDWNNFEYRPVYSTVHHRGIFEWGFLYKENRVPQQELDTRQYNSEPYRYSATPDPTPP